MWSTRSSIGSTIGGPILGGEEVAQVVEAVRALDRSPEREISREEDIGPAEGHEREAAARGPKSDPGCLRQGRLNLGCIIAQQALPPPRLACVRSETNRRQRPR